MKAKYTITGEIELDECYLEGEGKMSVKDIQNAVSEELIDANCFSDFGEMKQKPKVTVTISQ